MYDEEGRPQLLVMTNKEWRMYLRMFDLGYQLQSQPSSACLKEVLGVWLTAGARALKVTIELL
jgi:hypothetical protein